jgi:hypothetical protein
MSSDIATEEKMIRHNYHKIRRPIIWLTLLAICAMPISLFGQTRIVYHSNKFSPEDDVKLGRQAAGEAEQQLPILRDPEVTNYVERVGRRLVASIPPEFQHPEFQYYFRVVNASDINAFALPGGPMYVNRGMIEAARNEGEMAGVMAHELSHVALRHGTAQATKAQKYGLLAGILGVGGAILGGPAGSAIGQGGQLAVGAYFLKFSREYETEADILGSQMMARAGYDPRDLANMFRTIEQQGGGGGGFLSDHPSPANRYQRILQEAQYLRVVNPIRDTPDFDRTQARLRGYPRAMSTAEIARTGQRYPADDSRRYPDEGRRYPDNAPVGRVEYPSTRYRTYNESFMRVSVPDNWQEIRDNNSLWFAPQGAYGQSGGRAVFTHGVNFGVMQTQSRYLQGATDELLRSLSQSNRNLRQVSGYQRITISGRAGLLTGVRNINEATGRPESIRLATTTLRDGSLFYMIVVAPEEDVRDFDYAFNQILSSVRLND